MFTPNRNMSFVTLSLSWSTSKGRDTYGYNICRLDDEATGKRYKTCGGGYDMVGTVLGEWLQDVMQQELMFFAELNKTALVDAYHTYKKHPDLYGLFFDMEKNVARVDGGCGESSVIKIAEALSLIVEYKTEKKRVKGAVRVGFYVSKAE